MAQPDWENRMPGEQWLIMDTTQAAEAYLATYAGQDAQIRWEDWPNAEGLYARIRFPNRIPQHRVYVNTETE